MADNGETRKRTASEGGASPAKRAKVPQLDVGGLRGLSFDLAACPAGTTYSDIITPPFDVITEDEREVLAARSPANVTHVILPQGSDPYATAKSTFEGWIESGMLKQDDGDFIYVMEQTFTVPATGAKAVRMQFIGTAKIDEDGEDLILGHEQTFQHKVNDRVRLTRAVDSNLGVVMVMYADEEGELQGMLAEAAAREPDMEADTIDNVHVRVWRVAVADTPVHSFFKKDGKKLYIIDGHHRTATARFYRDERRAADGDGADPNARYNRILFGFVAASDPGFVILPTHRAISLPEGMDTAGLRAALEPHFDLRDADADTALYDQVNAVETSAFAFKTKDAAFIAVMKEGARDALMGQERSEAWRSLDVAILHKGILTGLLDIPDDAVFDYETYADRMIALVDEGKRDCAIILRDIPASSIFDCADAKDMMPRKATYVFPKLCTGTVFHPLGDAY